MKVRILLTELMASKQIEESRAGKPRVIDESVVAMETGLSINTIKSWTKGDVTRFDTSVLIAFWEYFRLKSLDQLIEMTPDEQPQ